MTLVLTGRETSGQRSPFARAIARVCVCVCARARVRARARAFIRVNNPNKTYYTDSDVRL